MWLTILGGFIAGCVLGTPVAPLLARSASIKSKLDKLPYMLKIVLLLAAVVPIVSLLVLIYLFYRLSNENNALALSFIAGLTTAYVAVTTITMRTGRE